MSRNARKIQVACAATGLLTGALVARAQVGSLADGSTLVAWGDDSYGQVLAPAGNYRAISAGSYFNLAIRSDGTAIGWGFNGDGQISLPGFNSTRAISAGTFHSLLLGNNGTVTGFGYNASGELNAPSFSFIAISAGNEYSVGIIGSGNLVGWGMNTLGQTNVPAGTFSKLSCGTTFGVAIRTDGTLASWGTTAPAAPAGQFADVSAGYNHALAIRTDGTLAGWGSNTNGQINVPDGTFTDVAAGTLFSLGLRSDGSIAGWGMNNHGQSNAPVGTFVAISANGSDGLALRAQTDYPADLLISGTGITANLNRSITVAGDTTISTSVNFYNNPTARVGGTLILEPGTAFVGNGSIIADGLDLETDVTLPVNLALQSTGPLSGSGNLSLASGVALNVGLNSASIYTGNLSIPANALLDFTGAGFQQAAGLSLAQGGQMRASVGEQLRFMGPADSAGTIEVNQADIEFRQPFINASTGRINGTDSTLRFTAGLENHGQVNLSFGRHSISGNITNDTGASIIVSGQSQTTFWDGLNNNAGATVEVSTGSTAVFFGNVINAGAFSGGGTKFFEGGSSGVMGTLDTTGSTVVESGASLTANHIRENALTVNGDAQLLPGTINNGASRVASLEITGTLDLTDNKLIVANGDAGTFNGSSYTGIAGLVQSGRNGGQWNGGGIITTRATPGNNLTSLGVATADELGKVGQTFGGLILRAGDVLVMYTYGGDANLDGKINIDDYGLIDSHVGQSGSVFGWHNGDFNYDGKINIDDYGIIDANIGAQGAPIPTIANSFPGLTDGIVAVPEPASIGLVAIASAGLLKRRRQRREHSALSEN